MITVEQLQELEKRERAAWAEQERMEKLHKHACREWNVLYEELGKAKREFEFETEVERRIAERAQP